MTRENTILFPDLTPQQREAVELLASSDNWSYTQVAAKLKKHVRTLYRWRNEPAFAKALAHLVQVRTDEIYVSTTHGLNNAVEILKEISEDTDIRPTDRINAIKVLVDIWSKNKDYLATEITDELAERIERLEEVLILHNKRQGKVDLDSLTD